jgi:sulfate adenylyltransferase subunit 2
MNQIASNIKPSLLGLDAARVWDLALAYSQLQSLGQANNKRTAERRVQSLSLLPPEISEASVTDELGRAPNRLVLDWALTQARKQRQRVVFAELGQLPGGASCLFANDARGTRWWLPLAGEDAASIWLSIVALQKHIGKAMTLFAHGALTTYWREWTGDALIHICPQAYRPVPAPSLPRLQSTTARLQTKAPQLQRLEDESIHILREAVAESDKPAMLYSIGKDSGVMLHLARKAFYPAPPPFPLLHVDTRWKFEEMYLFRDRVAQESGMQLIVHTNPDAIARDINPFDHGSALHTDITKTQGLKQALDHYGFDLVFGGARRDEEKSRAKERVFSFRSASHRWDPKNQRPELWNLYNTRKGTGESIRVFPLSNWTELDVWQYICQEELPVVPLYFAKPRAVVVRPDMIMMVDDARCRLQPHEKIEIRTVRFRTLGCYPLSGALESQAQTPQDILGELINARHSERQGRKIDTDSAGSMEKKKQEGYF